MKRFPTIFLAISIAALLCSVFMMVRSDTEEQAVGWAVSTFSWSFATIMWGLVCLLRRRA